MLCCLRYEHDFYVGSRKRFPKEGRKIHTTAGAETVMAVDIFREQVLLRAEDGSTRNTTLTELKQDVASVEGTTDQPPKPPSALVAFEEAHPKITAEDAAEAVAPRKRKRRKRRGRRRGGGGSDRENRSDDSSKGKSGNDSGR